MRMFFRAPLAYAVFAALCFCLIAMMIWSELARWLTAAMKRIDEARRLPNDWGFVALAALVVLPMLAGHVYAQVAITGANVNDSGGFTVTHLYDYACANESTIVPWLEWLVGIVGGSKAVSWILRLVDRFLVKVPKPLLQMADALATNWVTSTLQKGPPVQAIAAQAYSDGTKDGTPKQPDHPLVEAKAREIVADVTAAK